MQLAFFRRVERPYADLRPRPVPLFIFLLGLLFVSPVFAAPPLSDCQKVSETCLQAGGERIIDGFPVTRACWKWQRQYNCKRTAPRLDTCASLKATPGCRETSRQCVNKKYGVCLDYEVRYQCGTQAHTRGGVVLVDSQYTITRDALVSQCAAQEADKSCTLGGEACIEAGGTRMIDGLAVTKSCWKYARRYNCYSSSFVSDCDGLDKNAQCVEVAKTCEGRDKDGACTHYQKQFHCEASASDDVVAQCGSAQWCIDGDCEAHDYAPNQGFGRVASAMSAIGSFNDDYDGVRLFKGKWKSCRKWPLNLKNCCADDGLLVNLDLASCDGDERELAAKLPIGRAHYVRSRCTSRIPLIGICTQRKREYCTFDSRMARVVQEGVRPQLGISWNDCRGLTPQELTRIDWDGVDLSEVIGDVYNRMTTIDKAEIARQVEQRITNFYEANKPEPAKEDDE